MLNADDKIRDELRKTAKLFSVPVDQLPSTIRRFRKEVESYEKK